MTWHRGLVVCRDDVLPRVREYLGQSTVFCEIVSRGGETALAFAGSGEPDPGPDAVAVGIDARNLYFYVSGSAFRPETLVPTVGLTVGIVLKSGDAVSEQWSAFRRSLWEKLGPTENEADNGKCAGFRWDIKYPFYERSDNVLLEKLQAIEKDLVKSGTAYWMTRFDHGWGKSCGDSGVGEDCTEVADEIYLGPSAVVNIEWTDADGTEKYICATEAEFTWDEEGSLPESEVWSM